VANRFMEFIHTRLDEAVINVQCEKVIYVPTSKTEVMAMLIHKITFDLTSLERVDTKQTMVIMALSKDSLPSAFRYGSNPRIIAGYGAALDCGMIEGTLTEFQQFQEYGAQVQYFDPPILVAQDQLYLQLKTYEQLSLTYGLCVIGYTLEKVSREAFIAALVS